MFRQYVKSTHSRWLNHTVGRRVVQKWVLDIVRELCKMKQGNGNLQIAIALFYLNTTKFSDHVLELLKWIGDLEALYRSYQALGNLTCTPFGQITSTQIISVDTVVDKIRDNMSVVLPSGFEKLNELARDLTSAL